MQKNDYFEDTEEYDKVKHCRLREWEMYKTALCQSV